MMRGSREKVAMRSLAETRSLTMCIFVAIPEQTSVSPPYQPESTGMCPAPRSLLQLHMAVENRSQPCPASQLDPGCSLQERVSTVRTGFNRAGHPKVFPPFSGTFLSLWEGCYFEESVRLCSWGLLAGKFDRILQILPPLGMSDRLTTE
jgi:hypothetical protein